MALMDLVRELEQRVRMVGLRITIEGDDVTADVFETLASLAAFVDASCADDVHDLAIITVSTNESHWIRPLLPTLFEHMGDISGDVVVVDNDSHDGIAEIVADEFPRRAHRVVAPTTASATRNNRGLMTCNARYVLFLNPDTEILEGTSRSSCG